MPKILTIKEIDGEAWVRIGVPGEFPSGVALWTPEEQAANYREGAKHMRERAAERFKDYKLPLTTTQGDATISETIRTLPLPGEE